MNALSGLFGQCWRSGYQAIDRHKTDSSDDATTEFAGDNLYRETEPLYACRMDKMDVLLSELEKDASIVNQDYRSGKSGCVMPLLCIAAFEGNLDIVRVLIENGADINQGAAEGHTPLLYAAFSGNFNTVQFLINKGALIDKAAKDGSTPLYIASQGGYIRIVKLLLDAGADPNKKWKVSGSSIQKSPQWAAKNIAKDKVMADMIKKAIKEREVTPAVVDPASLRVSEHQNQYVSYGAIS